MKIIKYLSFVLLALVTASAHARWLSVDPVGFKESNPASFNRYAYANNNPYKYFDPDGRETKLTVWQPVGWGESSFGHISVDINGTTYSFGPNGMNIMPTSDYLAKNSFRDGTAVDLKLDANQEKTLEGYLLKPQGKYSAIDNNCAAPVQRGLKEAGIDTEKKTLPVSLGNEVLDKNLVNGTENYPATKPATGTSAPWAK